MNEKFLIVKLDQYAGNVDEITCVALTGSGSDRYGSMQAREVFDAKIRPLLAEPDDEYVELPIEFMSFNTDYGTMPYSLDWSSTNNLRLGIDEHTTEEDIADMFKVWRAAYGNAEGHLEIVVPGIHNKTKTVKILGFDLVILIERRVELETI